MMEWHNFSVNDLDFGGGVPLLWRGVLGGDKDGVVIHRLEKPQTISLSLNTILIL